MGAQIVRTRSDKVPPPEGLLLDPEDEHLRYRVGISKTTGYPLIVVDGIQMALHKAIMQPPPGLVVDHIDGNKLDNRRCNLRCVTHRENIRNAKVPTTNRSGHKGVNFETRRQKWQAFIDHEGRRLWLGYHDTVASAVLARLTKEKELWGIQPRRLPAFKEAGLA